MLCAELEHLEGELEDLIAALEDPNLSDSRRKELEIAKTRISQEIDEHQASGHDGGPCYEEC